MLSNSKKSEIKKAAADVLRAAGIHSLPVDLNNIVDSCGWSCLAYLDAQNVGLITDSGEDGYTIGQNIGGEWKYVILYNDSFLPQRVRWTIAHEMGHIALKHIERGTIDGSANEEAQYFAEQLLSPIAVVARLGVKTAEDIARLCNISHNAANWRYKDFERHLWYREKYGYTKDDHLFLDQFEEFIAKFEVQ